MFHRLDRAVLRSIWSLGWPVMVAMVLESAMTIVDMFWVGRLGNAEVAGVTLSGYIVGTIDAFTQLAAAGILVLVSRAVGAGDREAADEAASSGVRLAAAVGVAIGAGTMLLAYPLVKTFDAPHEVIPPAVTYISLLACGLPFWFTGIAMRAAFQAAGDTRTPMRILVATNLLHLLADPCLIFGIGPIPPLGVAGAAIATVASWGVTMLLLWRATRVDSSHISFAGNGPVGLWARFLKVGVPAAAGWISRPLSGTFLFAIVAAFGTIAMAAFGIGMRLIGLAFIFYAGMSVAVATMVGQSLGAGKPERAQHVVEQAVLLGLIVQTVLSATTLVLAPAAVALFRDDPRVIEAGSRYLRVVAIGILAMPLLSAYAAGFAGAGDTRPPMAGAVIANWLVKIPAAWALAQLWETDGVWVGISASVVVEGLVNGSWFARGKWKTFRP